MRRAIAVAAAAALLVTGCTGTEGQAGTASAAPAGMIDFLNYAGFGGGAEPQANYNPYLIATQLGAVTYLYEKLVLFDRYSCTPKPWLAESYTWTDPKTLTFKLRPGVKWTDGQPLTAKDVAFSYNLIKRHAALDTAGVWQYLDTVEATGTDTVTMTFDEPGASVFTVVVGVYVVPEHIWSKVPDPVTFVNADKPVGSGPFTVKSFNRQQLVIERNPDYWQAGKVKVQEIRFHKADSEGTVEQLKLARGEYDTNAMFIPDVQKVYVDRDPEHNHYWYPPGSSISFYMNLTKKPFDDPAFRRALTTAFDHRQIIEKAQLGYVTQASQTALTIPGQEAWLPAGLAGDKGMMTYDSAKADAALTAAGYVKDAEGRRLGKDGKPLEFAFKTPSGWVDWLAAARIVVENLDALGIEVELETPTPETYDRDRAIGRYDTLFGVHSGSCNMFRNYQEPLGAAQSAPIGKKALSNFVRWNDEETEDLLAKLRVAEDEAEQKELVGGLAQIMVEKVPVIPLWYGAKWFQYRTAKAVGWPSAENPYAAPGDNLLIITNLKPA